PQGDRRSTPLAPALCLCPGLQHLLESESLAGDPAKGYNKELRPVMSKDESVSVDLGLTLSNLVSLKEADETLTTNVWIDHGWTDYRLQWNKSEFGDLKILRLPPDMVWLPEIVLENNNDGFFQIAYYCNVLVYDSGFVYWLPPAIFHSACPINVNFFPFDWQNCSLKFRSQTYSANEINLLLTVEDGQTIEWIVIDPEAFTENGEWRIQHALAKKKGTDQTRSAPLAGAGEEQSSSQEVANMAEGPACGGWGADPGSCLAFCIPAAGGQKCTVSINVLLAQTVFLFLIAQKVPETSDAMPLIGRYLTFLLVVTVLIVANAVIVLNVSLRTPNTHSMSQRVRQICLRQLPHFLGMHMRRSDVAARPLRARRRSSLGLMVKADEYMLWKARTELIFEKQKERDGLMKAVLEKIGRGLENGRSQDLCHSLVQAGPESKACVDACNHIARTLQEQNDFDNGGEGWQTICGVQSRPC
uniref:Cholinergic receptor nicotinic gamma subunit n=1 Tax=Pelodiscus sinensis TaxID=13735 RepID=K7FXG2_PELSI